VIRNDDLDPVLVVGIGGAIVEQAVSVAGARLPLDRESAQDLLERSGLATHCARRAATGQLSMPWSPCSTRSPTWHLH